ncbi:binding-protein-dependent transport systems inner membrane component [Beutenbergia cavernae DSM 12333]|uniref:Binding-protein-dependent transport systems inner membrane component n=1 Tax=Beutenbergia cavernae (strain ATCC BAA-8 / DSM 12333 / CCUG 43141 / JCM 11478 / NBRC 16432 / NCIMB 13614 / HKI 0122) TaxID=471853 RepID=C5C3K9_BEUC1|nr:sugar ABC transporter permease [Beutenbergia cavernae]ACQ81918.1 binding-protein-dependent transport systems inner membrane component [Beutenbergia cavernae DSM 12333]
MTLAVEPRVAPPGAAVPRRRRHRSAVPYALIVPALVFYAVVVLYPTVAGGVYAFTDWTGRRVAPQFVGLDNFVELFSAPAARSALRNTLVIAVSTTIVQTLLGLALALALHSVLASRNVLRTLFFAPALLPPVIIGFLWQYILTPAGPLNDALEAIGLGGLTQNWLGDASVALASVIGVIIWQNAGLTMVIYLAGLQGVPAELLEAAAIDGASRWQRLRRVTIPLLIPATTIAMSLTLIGSLKLFDQVYVMTGGGPGYATETLSVVMYKEAFVSGRYGYSAAIALVLTMIVFAFAFVQLRGLRRFEVDA